MEIPFSIRYNNVKLKVERLYKTSTRSSKRLFSGLEDISFILRGGECIHLKSPVPWANQLLLETLTGHTQIEAGAIWVNHQDEWLNLSQLSQRRTNQVHTQTIGYLQPPNDILRAYPTVLDCVLTNFLSLGLLRRQADAQSRHILDWVGLPRRLWYKAPTELSLAELQQVNLARTFAVDYSIIVIGLPISQLTPDNQAKLVELIEHRKAQGTSFIGRFDQSHARKRVCDRSLDIHVPTPISAAARKPRPAAASYGNNSAPSTHRQPRRSMGAAASNIAARSY
ncbi:MAG: hypothetical protein AAFY17_02295 [Cyanobacteria bacterium J06642_11]